MAFKGIREWLQARLDEHVRPEVQALVRRGAITLAEYRAFRGNSWEWEHVAPALDDEAFAEYARHNLDNAWYDKTRPYRSYNEACMGFVAPELLRRFQAIIEEPHIAARLDFLVARRLLGRVVDTLAGPGVEQWLLLWGRLCSFADRLLPERIPNHAAAPNPQIKLPNQQPGEDSFSGRWWGVFEFDTHTETVRNYPVSLWILECKAREHAEQLNTPGPWHPSDPDYLCPVEKSRAERLRRYRWIVSRADLVGLLWHSLMLNDPRDPYWTPDRWSRWTRMPR